MTPKAKMLLDTIKESLTDLSTECWTEASRKQLKKVEDARDELEVSLSERASA